MKLYEGIFPSREWVAGFAYELVVVGAWVGLLFTLGHWIALALLVAVCWAAPFWWLAVELLTTLTNAKRRSVHDFLARSVVVRTDAS
jgi:hypothetical protein